MHSVTAHVKHSFLALRPNRFVTLPPLGVFVFFVKEQNRQKRALVDLIPTGT